MFARSLVFSLLCASCAALPDDAAVPNDTSAPPDALLAAEVAAPPSDDGATAAPDITMPPCPPPDGPTFHAAPAGAELHFTLPGDGLIEVAVTPGEEPSAWAIGPRAVLPSADTPVTVFARAADANCDTRFEHRYQVVDTFSVEDAVPLDDPRIVGWATGYEPPTYGSHVDAAWQTPDKALGPATGTAMDVVTLGRGGAIALTFDPPIADGPGPDLAVFENAFQPDFLELAWVEVSSDGVHYARFSSAYLGVEPVAQYGVHDPALIAGLAGRYPAAHGTPFDLSLLRYRPEVVSGAVNLAAITHVRVVDVVGDGQAIDSFGQPIYDPYPTIGSAGFDLEAVAVLAE